MHLKKPIVKKSVSKTIPKTTGMVLFPSMRRIQLLGIMRKYGRAKKLMIRIKPGRHEGHTLLKIGSKADKLSEGNTRFVFDVDNQFKLVNWPGKNKSRVVTTEAKNQRRKVLKALHEAGWKI